MRKIPNSFAKEPATVVADEYGPLVEKEFEVTLNFRLRVLVRTTSSEKWIRRCVLADVRWILSRCTDYLKAHQYGHAFPQIETTIEEPIQVHAWPLDKKAASLRARPAPSGLNGATEAEERRSPNPK